MPKVTGINRMALGVIPYNQLREEYIKFALDNYYRDHLEDFNDEFRDQMTEFKDGNIFFEIMQQEIWNKAQTDSSGLASLYKKIKKIISGNKVPMLLFSFAQIRLLPKPFLTKLKKKPADWKKITELYAEKIIADSSRYEWSQIPNLNKMIPKAGM